MIPFSRFALDDINVRHSQRTCASTAGQILLGLSMVKWMMKMKVMVVTRRGKMGTTATESCDNSE